MVKPNIRILPIFSFYIDSCNNAVLKWKTKIKNTWSDVQEATEKGAEGIAALLVNDFTPYKVIQRSAKSTGIDYWLGHKEDDNSGLIYQNAARLEISGLINGSNSEYNQRIKQKAKQTKQSENTKLPAYISITDFGKPRTTFKEV